MSRGLLRLSYLFWLVLIGIAVLAYQLIGPPYLLWSYTWRNDGQGYDPFATRHYLRCTYLGPAGSFTILNPKHGECPRFRFGAEGETS
ncbi:hypothetical protein ACSSV1_004880 [Labrenzia sp. MBR-25]